METFTRVVVTWDGWTKTIEMSNQGPPITRRTVRAAIGRILGIRFCVPFTFRKV